jgi:hypothetical protein
MSLMQQLPALGFTAEKKKKEDLHKSGKSVLEM